MSSCLQMKVFSLICSFSNLLIIWFIEYWFYVSSGHQSTIKSSLARIIPNDKIKKVECISTFKSTNYCNVLLPELITLNIGLFDVGFNISMKTCSMLTTCIITIQITMLRDSIYYHHN